MTTMTTIPTLSLRPLASLTATTGTARLVFQSLPPPLLRLSPLQGFRQQAVLPHLEPRDLLALLLPKQQAPLRPLVPASKASWLLFLVPLPLFSCNPTACMVYRSSLLRF